MVRAAVVADVVVRLPKTLTRSASVAEARRALEDDHIHMLLLVEAGRLLGTVVRDDLPDDGPDDGPVLPYAVLAGRTVPPSMDAEAVRRLLVGLGERRRAVIDGEGRLLGLVCLKRKQTGFCSDGDVASRDSDAGRRTEGSLR